MIDCSITASASKCYFCTEEDTSNNCGDFSDTRTIDCGDKTCATASFTMKSLVTGLTFHSKEHSCSHLFPILAGEDMCAGQPNKCFSHKDVDNQIFTAKDIEVCCCKGDL